MATLIFPRAPFEEHHPDDIDRMAAVLAAQGHVASRQDLDAAWREVSDRMCAGWLGLPEDDDRLLADLLSVLMEE